MNDIKWILFNAPKRSGKDVGADHLAMSSMESEYSYRIGFAWPLKSMCHQMLGIDPHCHAYDSEKDSMEVRIGPHLMSLRQFYIHYSENLKILYGKDVWSEILFNSVQHHFGKFCMECSEKQKFVIISDLGFVSEIEYLSKKVKPENILVIRVHREGCNYEGDSRNFISDYMMPEGVRQCDIYNNHTLEDYFKTLDQVKVGFLNNKELV